MNFSKVYSYEGSTFFDFNLIKNEISYLELTGKNTGLVTLTEGRYHQIKRMFGCYGAKVIELQRIGMGNFIFPKDL